MLSRREDGTITPKWNHGPTTAIRIPLVFKNQIVDYARALDSDTETSGKEALKLIDAYLKKECIDGREAARKYNSPRWYFFNKFREWVVGNKE